MTLDIEQALQWATGRTPAVLITIKKDGSPQSSDVAFAVIDGEIVISITDDRAKTANMRRDPRVVLHITAPADWSYASFSGEVMLSPVTTEPDDATSNDLVAYYEQVTGGPHPDWDEYRSAMIAEKRLTGRLRPSRAVGHIRST